MNRRQYLASLAVLPVGRSFAQSPPAAPTGELTLVDVIVGEFSTSLRLPDNFAFVSGMPVYLAFRVAGLQRQSELNLVSFDYAVEAVDGLGQPFDQPHTGRVTRRLVEEEIAPAPLVRVSVKVPDYVYPAEAKFRIRVTDRFSKKTTAGEAAIPIRSELPKPSGKLEILRLQLFRSEFDEKPVEDAVFRPGDPVWVRFLVAGFQWKDREYNLSYDLSVLTRDGRVVLAAPDAAAERNSSPYPRPYIPAVASVRLERSARPGEYSVTVNASDDFAKATASASVPFRITAA